MYVGLFEEGHISEIIVPYLFVICHRKRIYVRLARKTRPSSNKPALFKASFQLELVCRATFYFVVKFHSYERKNSCQK